MTNSDERLHRVDESKAWEYCLRCRQPFSFEDLIYSGIDVHGMWRWECVFCREEGRYKRGMSSIERIRARTVARQRLFDAIGGKSKSDMPPEKPLDIQTMS